MASVRVRAGLRNEKRFAIFSPRFAIANHFDKVIRNCESLFIIYSHFCSLYINLYKRGNLSLKKGWGPNKKRTFGESIWKVIRNQPKVIRSKNLAYHFAKQIRNYPKSDSHLAMRIRLFPALVRVNIRIKRCMTTTCSGNNIVNKQQHAAVTI